MSETSPPGHGPGPETTADTSCSNRKTTPSASDKRNIIRLMQCPVCSRLLREPVTLPCGRAVCQHCLPDPRTRRNITYPNDINRVWRINCPIPSCGKGHAAEDCKPDAVLRLAVDAVTEILEKGSRSTVWSEKVTNPIIGGGPAQTTVPPLDGSLVAVYTSVREGLLGYSEDGTFQPASPETDGCAAFDAELLEQIRKAAEELVGCQVCLNMLHDPVTTPCGHTFCRLCLEQVLGGGKRQCPLCRRELLILPHACPPNAVLSMILGSFWPDVVVMRQAEVAETWRNWQTPYGGMFIHVYGEVLFPGIRKVLRMSKNKHRDMTNMVDEGANIFGVVTGTDNDGDFTMVGTAVRLAGTLPFDPDHYRVIVDGLWRFSIIEHMQDHGCRIARIRRLHDIGIAEEEDLEAEETSNCSLRLTTKEDIGRVPTSFLVKYAVGLIRRHRRSRSAQWLDQIDRYALYHNARDAPEDPVLLPWWFASFILSVSTSEKSRLLACTSVRERLKICWEWLFDRGLGPPSDLPSSSRPNLHHRCRTM
ncbi:PUA-like domain-containing protein [Achaetomium macrosporum]|uniref:PUA-like domain-containing protein n=1 Tax=Achaetomium macrosporum TaxID=79813 RepID=A0AAN7C598_9PEZI|nr:PUA-like domain-containing protein [Achaetomium macrosporum]